MFTVPETPVSLPTTCGSSCVKVYARTRPLLEQESSQGARTIVRIQTEEKQVHVEDVGEKFFKFENVFANNATQEEVYRTAVASLVGKVAEGQKATVLAYGQTGSGKTFTMGTDPCRAEEDEGILQRSMFELLNHEVNGDQVERDQKNCVSLSFLEVYNEVIYDLLATSRIPIKTKTGYGGAVSPMGMVEETVSSVEEGLKLLERGSHHRSVSSTALNQHSSRSHALIYITVQNGAKNGCLILVDLAGAEGVGRAQTSGQQLMEGIHINKGLLTLGKVLSALSNPASGYVPYRESILTRLLKDSLGGNSHTAMIACVSPASCNYHETINTLRYAEQAQNIRMKPQVPSTIKKSSVKRRYEDVTATPGALKRRKALSVKKDHNTTVSTPGHKPARRALPMFNNTFTTPSMRVNDVVLNSSMVGGHNFPPSMPHVPLSQPIFEDDSPSRFSTISAMENPEIHPPNFSPYMAQMTNRLEQSMMSHLESIEDRVADRIISKLKSNRKGKRPRKSMKRLNSPRADDGRSSSDSSDDSLSSVTMALLGNTACKKVLKTLMSGLIKDIQGESQSNTLQEQGKNKKTFEEEAFNVRKPFSDISNMANTAGDAYPHLNAGLTLSNKPTIMDDHPLTSTTFNHKRHVRRSTRMSTKRSIHNAIFEKMSPFHQNCPVSPSLFSESKLSDQRVQEKTVILDLSGGSPNLPSKISNMTPNSDMEETKIYESVFQLPTNYTTLDLKEENVNGTLNITSSSPLQIDRLNKTNAPVRRSTRVSAIRATQRNFTILTGSSPASTLCKKKANAALNTSKATSQNVTVHAIPAVDVTLNNEKPRWKLMMSPGQQEKYNREILDILNTGTVRQLQQLPTIGPKTAMIIYNHRQMYGKLNSVEDVAEIPALSKTFYTRFMKANLMNRLEL